MIDPISLTLAALSLTVSGVTAWATLFRRGNVILSRPMVIYFGPDNYDKRRSLPKIYIRSLIFSTSKRGQIIESMFARLTIGEARQNFSIWVYGERGKLVRGSGLYVGETGASLDHHFCIAPEHNEFKFREGRYHLDIFIKLLGHKAEKKAFNHTFDIDKTIALEMNTSSVGVYFDWGPDSQKYWPHIDEGPDPTPDATELMKFLTQSSPAK